MATKNGVLDGILQVYGKVSASIATREAEKQAKRDDARRHNARIADIDGSLSLAQAELAETLPDAAKVVVWRAGVEREQAFAQARELRRLAEVAVADAVAQAVALVADAEGTALDANAEGIVGMAAETVAQYAYTLAAEKRASA